ncbi:MAG: hypothetical protein U1F41_09015 [Burkholderiales bacterium]
MRQPTLLMKSGEVQQWRFVNAGTFNMLNLSLDGHTLYQLSHDGNPRRTMKLNPRCRPRRSPPATPPPTSYPEGLVLAVGNRSSVLVKRARRHVPAAHVPDRERPQSGRRARWRRARDRHRAARPYPMNLLPEPLPVTPFLTRSPTRTSPRTAA